MRLLVALHVRAIGLQHDEDSVIFDRAATEDRIVVSADTDFAALLASRQDRSHSGDTVLVVKDGRRSARMLHHCSEHRTQCE